MKKNAHEIFKKVYSEHRDIVTRDRNSCLGILMDYGGREYPETYLFADALEIHIEKQVSDNQPITEEALETIARDFASKKSVDYLDAKFAVETWADAMGFHQFDPSKYDNLTPSGANGSDPHSKSLKKKNSKTSDILLIILLGPIIVLWWITKIGWRQTKSILKAGSAVNQVKTSPILDNSMPIFLQHTLFFVTFPSILAGLMIGILLPLIGLLMTSIIFLLPFFFNNIINKKDYGKIINCSNFCFNILPTSITNSQFFNIIFSSNFLIGLASEWSNYSNCKSLFIYMYALMSVTYFLYYFFATTILNFL